MYVYIYMYIFASHIHVYIYVDMIDCCPTNDHSFFSNLKLDNELLQATETLNDILRLPSNSKRKRLYKLVFFAYDFGIYMMVYQ
jgi:hypothetical protein